MREDCDEAMEGRHWEIDNLGDNRRRSRKKRSDLRPNSIGSWTEIDWRVIEVWFATSAVNIEMLYTTIKSVASIWRAWIVSRLILDWKLPVHYLSIPRRNSEWIVTVKGFKDAISFGEPPSDDGSSTIPRHWNYQIHPSIRFIHRSGGNFLHGIESISEIALVCSILRENNSNDLFDIPIWYWQPPIIPTENRTNKCMDLTVGISGIWQARHEKSEAESSGEETQTCWKIDRKLQF
jgi:hypothetical protein